LREKWTCHAKGGGWGGRKKQGSQQARMKREESGKKGKRTRKLPKGEKSQGKMQNRKSSKKQKTLNQQIWKVVWQKKKPGGSSWPRQGKKKTKRKTVWGPGDRENNKQVVRKGEKGRGESRILKVKMRGKGITNEKKGKKTEYGRPWPTGKSWGGEKKKKKKRDGALWSEGAM